MFYTNSVQKKSIFKSFDSFTPLQLCTKATDLVLCCISLVGLPDDNSLRKETCRNIHCDIVMQISEAQVWHLIS